MHLDTDALIVGAGPTGLTLACELARRGVPHRLVDAADGPFLGSRGKGTQPRTLEVFNDLGIADEVVAAGRFHLPIRYHAADGSIEDVDPHAGREPRPDVPYASSLIIPQWRVEQAIRERLTSLGSHVHHATSLTSLQHDEEGVTATLLHAGTEQRVRARYVVGCDGGRSTTRKLAGIAFLGETLEQHRMMIADVSATGLDRDHWHTWRNADGFLAMAPLPGTQQFQLQVSVAAELGETPDRILLQQLVATRSGREDIVIGDPTWMSFWRCNVRMVDRFRAGPILLAGDAAHVHSPAGGQGMNTGIQDAYNLGWKLAHVLQGADATLLDSYEHERMPVARDLLGLSNRLHGETFNGQRIVTRRGPETLQLGIGYRDSALSQQRRAGCDGLAAGDRAPDAPALRDAGGEHRVFDLLRGTHVTVLAFGAGWDACVEALQAQHGERLRSFILDDRILPGHLQDRLGHAAQAYGVVAATLFVIRPDGYVALVTDDLADDAIATCLTQLLPPA